VLAILFGSEIELRPLPRIGSEEELKKLYHIGKCTAFPKTRNLRYTFKEATASTLREDPKYRQ
jgi:hypothetical protein